MASYQQAAADERAPASTTAVAIDRDKNSQHAVKWAVDNLLVNSSNITLIHVRNRHAVAPSFSMTEGSTASTREQIEGEMQQLYLPFRGFCARKGITVTEVILENIDVSRAVIDYINSSCVHNVVVGASGRNAFTRKFKNADVATTLTRSAPDFCTVYVIAKGKAMTVRSATRQIPSPAVPAAPLYEPKPLDDAVKTPFARLVGASAGQPPPAAGGGWRSPAQSYLERRALERGSDFMKAAARGALPGELDGFPRQPRLSHGRDSISDGLDFHGSALSVDFAADDLEFSAAPTDQDSPRSSLSSVTMRDVEAEMKRLKLELKQTMDMYNTACREAVSAKQKAKEYQEWKRAEARKFEEARQAEEEALAIAEMEKAKCRAAIEAAEAAQRLAELEAQKRKSAEMKARRAAEERKKALDVLAHNDVRYRRYTIEEIEVATDFFSETLKIGEGGYGPVYVAVLDHTAVAIKVLRPDAAQGRRQFQQEVEVLSCMRHPNMVLLLGACPEYGCLVYEYMDNGSLEDRLFRRGNTPPIPWQTRFRIAAEIATGLLFLHQAKPEPLVHRDLKPGNILLDRNYTGKISDVGLARLVPPSVANTVTQYRMTSTAGTFCYIDPEYQQTGMLGIKSDIYSLGIMLLQIITAKQPMGLTHHVERAIDKGTFAEILDPEVADWPVEEALLFAKLALGCSELRRKDRPDLGTVVLPELNRLRNLGSADDGASSSGTGAAAALVGPRSGPNPRSRQGMSNPVKSNLQFLSSTTEETSGSRNPSGLHNTGSRLVPRKLVP